MPPDLSAQADVFRSDLRRACLAARSALPPAQRAAYTAGLAAHLAGWFADRAPTTFGFCLPHRDEPDLAPLAAALVARGWRAAVPVVVESAAPMVFRAWTSDAPLGADRHGIAIPLTTEVATPDVLLMPVVAVDAAGYRLGYGGGYFDRTLAALDPRPLCIGVGFECARVADIRPQTHDARLDWIATEAGLSRFA